jgi:1,4-dihydroxy-2-naphthoate octaprenyltransferase
VLDEKQKRQWWAWLLLYILLGVGLVALAVGYLLALRPPDWPVFGWKMIASAITLMACAAVTILVPKEHINSVGVLISILLAVIGPTVFITARARDLADDAMSGKVVHPFSILQVSRPGRVNWT